jgi:hypothetical protein
MTRSRPVPLAEVRADLREVTDRIIWSVLTTVGPDSRPRSRIVHPVWDHATTPPTGYVTSRPTPLRRRHLAANPHVSCAYWSPEHDAVYVDARAGWLPDPADRRAVWTLISQTPPPVGYDLATIWPDGPDSPDFAVIRLIPYRIRIARAAAMAAGAPSPMWTDGAG